MPLIIDLWGLRLPDWTTHSRYAHLFKLNVEICRKIDKYIDEGSIANALASLIGKELKIHDFGRRGYGEFMYGVKYVYEKYGAEGVKCFLLHHVLDYIDYLVKRRYDADIIRDKVALRFSNFLNSTLLEQEFDPYLRNTVREFLNELLQYVSLNISIIVKDLEAEIFTDRIVYDRLRGLIQGLCSLELVRRGRRSRGFRARYDEYVKLSTIVLKEFRSRLHEFMEGIDPYELINELNIAEKESYRLRDIFSKTKTLSIVIKRLMDLIKSKADELGYESEWK